MPSQPPQGIIGIPPAPVVERPDSTTTTDIGQEYVNGGPFGKSKFRPRTPRPRPPITERPISDSDSDQEHRPTEPKHPSKTGVQPVKLIHEGTQSEEKSTRNVGTMHEAVQTRNFGNEVQPQSSSTQTSLPAKDKPSFVYIERPEPPTPASFHQPRISSRSPPPFHQPRIPSRSPPPLILPPTDTYYDLYRRSPSPCIKDYSYYEEDHPPRRHHSTSPPPPPPISYRCTPRLPPGHPPVSFYRPHTPSPSNRSRHLSPIRRRPHSATPRYRPQMHSQETDTSLDAMKYRHHIGVQYEPRSTRETGTSPSVRIKQPIPASYRSMDTSIYPAPHSSLPRYRDRIEKSYYIQPTVDHYYYDDYEDEEEEEDDLAPSMHDQSTMADLIVNLDHYTQCDSQPYMADHYVQTTSTLDDYDQRDTYDNPEELFVRQLPVRGSISIHQPVVVQPDSLPRPRRSHHSPTHPKRDGLDYTGKILEVSLHHGRQERTTSRRDSPLLNIGTQHIVHQTPTDEYTIPFETRYITDSVRSSTLRSRSNSTIVVPVLNSPRTHLFTNNSLRQSRSNGNFFLSSAPPRSLNSLFRLDITTDQC